MKSYIALTLVLLTAADLAQADDLAERIAVTRSAGIVDAIDKGEVVLEKAISLGDENGYLMEVARPMARRLQWWRELAQKDPNEFKKYEVCLSAGVAFNRFGSDRWDSGSLSQERRTRDGAVRYKTALKACRLAIKAGIPKPR